MILQGFGPHFLDSTFAEFLKLEWPEGDPNEACHIEAEMLQHALDLAVLALAQIHREPGIITDFTL